MRRADRLFSLIQLIRGKRFTTARHLATQLEVSLRTVYRNVADLQQQGVPIEGEAGVGYRMGNSFDLPPLMFTHDEARSMAAAMRIEVERMPVFSPPWGLNAQDGAHLQTLREAAQDKRLLTLAYVDQTDHPSQRTVRPLGCFYWGKVWTLVAWCEMRHDFRNVRIDRITTLQVLDAFFKDKAGKTLQDILQQQSCWPTDSKQIEY